MKYFIRDYTMDITCSTGELYTMWERGQRIYGELPTTASHNRVMRPYIAERPRYHYDPVLATWEDFNDAYWDGEGYLTITIARDPLRPRGPRVAGADENGQLRLFPLPRPAPP